MLDRYPFAGKGWRSFSVLICLTAFGVVNPLQKMDTKLSIVHVEKDFAVAEFDNNRWRKAKAVSVKTYWSGEPAPKGRRLSVRLLWSDTALYVRFEALRNEPLVVSEKPNLWEKVIGLWDRDVCEIFIAPDPRNRDRYFEYEIAPTGEWIDLAIEVKNQKRNTDLDYRSRMTSAATIEKDRVVMVIKIPWEAFSTRPKVGDIWLGNLFRCVGKYPTRGYLAWQPTKTAKPNFHVPEAFGEFQFSK